MGGREAGRGPKRIALQACIGLGGCAALSWEVLWQIKSSLALGVSAWGTAITLAFMDGPTRTVGVGPTFTPTGDLSADMDLVRAFYADKHGLHPEKRTEPRLRNEG